MIITLNLHCKKSNKTLVSVHINLTRGYRMLYFGCGCCIENAQSSREVFDSRNNILFLGMITGSLLSRDQNSISLEVSETLKGMGVATQNVIANIKLILL